MRVDVDFLIELMEKYTTKTVSELGEQDAAASDSSSTGGGGKNNVTKWEDIVKVTRGKANPLGKSDEKWASGVARTGPANPVELKKWSDVVQTKRGPGNQLT
jgi:hypothetical protein